MIKPDPELTVTVKMFQDGTDFSNLTLSPSTTTMVKLISDR